MTRGERAAWAVGLAMIGAFSGGLAFAAGDNRQVKVFVACSPGT